MRLSREGDGWAVRLAAEERELLARLAGELRALVEAGVEAGGVERLFPPAHEDAREAEELDRLVRPSLVAAKTAALAELERTARAERLTARELEAWATALNDLRLVLGTRHGVEEDPPEERWAEPGIALYGWLSWVQGTVIEALANELPHRGD